MIVTDTVLIATYLVAIPVYVWALLYIQRRKNSASFIIIVVSEILTVFFGVIRLVPLLTPSKPQPNITVEKDALPAGVRPPAERPLTLTLVFAFS